MFGVVRPSLRNEKDENDGRDQNHINPDDKDSTDSPFFPDPRETYAQYYLNGIKGFWTGFSQGFYHNTKLQLNERCLNDKVTEEI